MKITLYTTPGCVQCRMTSQWLDRAGIPYRTVDLSESPDDMAAVKAMGYSSAPVVFAEAPDGWADHWSGFRPDKLMVATNRPQGEVA